MPRTNHIGANVQNTQKTEIDKENAATQPNETELRYAYPELTPGRALINVKTGELIEFQHRMPGFTDTVEGRLSKREEDFNEEYRTPKGQDWGGIIEHSFISFNVRACPRPNNNGEIHVPTDRPSEADIVDVSPETFEDLHLFKDNGRAEPLLLVERPEVTYNEIVTGETYTIKGWFDPTEDTEKARLKATEDIATAHPEIIDAEYTTYTERELSFADTAVRWNDGATALRVDAYTDENNFAFERQSGTTEFTIRHVNTGDGVYLILESPFEAKDTITGSSLDVTWNPGRIEEWGCDPTVENLKTALSEFSDSEWTVCIDSSVVEAFSEDRTRVDVSEEESASLEEIFDFTFTKTTSVKSMIEVPGAGVTFDPAEFSPEAIVELTRDDSGSTEFTVDERQSAGENHIVIDFKEGNSSADAEKLCVDCPDESEAKSLAKSPDWKEAQYNYIISTDRWEMNQCAADTVLSAFLDAGRTVTSTVDSLISMGERVEVEEMETVEASEEPSTVESYSASDAESSDIELNEESTCSCQDVFGASDVNEKRLTLLNIDLTVADADDSENRSISIGDCRIPQIPEQLSDEWHSNTDGMATDEYEWFHPETSARIHVEVTSDAEEVSKSMWGEEYVIYVKTPKSDEEECIGNVATEKQAALTVISHLKGYSMAFN